MANLFELGQIVQTAGVANMRKENQYFDLFVELSLNRYRNGDWGDTCEEDAKLNDESVKAGERILAVYIYDWEDVCTFIRAREFYTEDTPSWKKTKDKDPDGTKIWIITEWDRSVTTILFPSEY